VGFDPSRNISMLAGSKGGPKNSSLRRSRSLEVCVFRGAGSCVTIQGQLLKPWKVGSRLHAASRSHSGRPARFGGRLGRFDAVAAKGQEQGAELAKAGGTTAEAAAPSCGSAQHGANGSRRAHAHAV
jgi:hypothetical protein